jgi:hypothetical protein
MIFSLLSLSRERLQVLDGLADVFCSSEPMFRLSIHDRFSPTTHGVDEQLKPIKK